MAFSRGEHAAKVTFVGGAKNQSYFSSRGIKPSEPNRKRQKPEANNRTRVSSDLGAELERDWGQEEVDASYQGHSRTPLFRPRSVPKVQACLP